MDGRSAARTTSEALVPSNWPPLPLLPLGLATCAVSVYKLEAGDRRSQAPPWVREVLTLTEAAVVRSCRLNRGRDCAAARALWTPAKRSIWSRALRRPATHLSLDDGRAINQSGRSIVPSVGRRGGVCRSAAILHNAKNSRCGALIDGSSDPPFDCRYGSARGCARGSLRMARRMARGPRVGKF